jgi:hypothetical protein
MDGRESDFWPNGGRLAKKKAAMTDQQYKEKYDILQSELALGGAENN